MVSVIVPTKNREKSLKRCLASLKGVEVIVERGGESLAEARDLGWRKAKGEIVVYIDDDCEVTKDWLKAIVETFKDPKVAGVSGPTIVSKDEIINRDVFSLNRGIAGWFYNKIILEGRGEEVGKIVGGGWWTMGANRMIGKQDNSEQSIIEVDYLEACNMAVRRELIKKAGGFDLNFMGTSEWCEVDLAFRIRKLGYKLVFNPKAAVYHHLEKSGVFKARVNGPERLRNFIRYYLKNHRQIGQTEIGAVSTAPFRCKYLRFLITILFMEGYFIYKALTERNIK